MLSDLSRKHASLDLVVFPELMRSCMITGALDTFTDTRASSLDINESPATKDSRTVQGHLKTNAINLITTYHPETPSGIISSLFTFSSTC
jgi:hypothetical protein